MIRTESETLLESAKRYLSDRKLQLSRDAAYRLQNLDPQNPIVPQILAVVDTLHAAAETNSISETLPDWYAILGVTRYSNDILEIKDQYKKLCLLLDPNETFGDELPFAREAFSHVNKAWYELSNKSRKSQYDSIIKNQLELVKSMSSLAGN